MLRNIILLLVLSIVVHAARAANVKSLNQMINQKNAKWKAGVTSVSVLPKEDQLKLLGAPELMVDEFVVEYNHKQSKYPDRLDWRNINGINFMSPITNQGRCGSCVAFAAIGAFEAQMNISNNWPALNMNFSEQELFACGGGACNRGWTPYSALYNMKRKGVVDEACLTYTSGSSGNDVRCSKRCADEDKRRYYLNDYHQSKSETVLSARDVIEDLQNGPLLARMNVYEDFMNYTSGVYSHVSGGYLGGHAIVIVGYDAVEEYWIVRNSWGTKWGEEGYFRIKFDDASGVGRGTYGLEIDPSDGVIKIQDPDYRQIIKGTHPVEMLSTLRDAGEVTLDLKKNGATWSFSAERQKEFGKFIANLNTSELVDGVYEAQAILNTSKKQITSQIKNFYIVNNVPEMAVNIAKPRNGSVINGKVVIEINPTWKQVPMMSLFLHIKYPDGHVKTVKNYYPASVTKMSWKTADSPDGKYELWAEGFIGDHKVTSSITRVTVSN